MAVHDALPDDPAMSTLITYMQAAFTARGQTLADDSTAHTYRTTLEKVDQMLKGALATGVLTPEAHETLHGMIASAMQVPDLL